MRRVDFEKADRTYLCRCGKRIYAFHDTLEICHGEPVCDWFKALLANRPPDKTERVEAK